MPMKHSSSIITTPYEKVLTIINEAKKFINLMSKNQTKLIRGLEWVIKVITSHSLYSYELKDHEILEQYFKDNPNFKQFVDFVSEYNEEVIEMNKKKNIINSQSVKISNDLLNIPSFKLKRNYLNQSIKSNIPNQRNSNKYHSNNTDSLSSNGINKISGINLSVNSLKGIMKPNPNCSKNSPNKNEKKTNKNQKNSNNQSFNSQNIQNHNYSNLNNMNSPLLKEKNSPFNQKKSQIQKKPQFENSFNYIETCIQLANFSPKKILEKDFNIFELKKIIGHTNILPLMGKIILESFGLIDESIISINKLDKFLFSITNEYLTSTLYHNSMHGADVTQTVCLYFLNSNAEEICKTNVIDLLSILIASLGHDIGHPGLTNNFQINALTDMALTYNDISCLENFHVSKLFRILKKDENNIFEKLNSNDFKIIRKRMVSEILATDMANHGKVMTVIKARISNEILEGNKDIKFELLSGNPKNKFEEQQALLDFFIHSADLAHNTKLFKISIQWVELLSNEFWLQGDKEKQLNLPVSFLCDRIGCNVPSSQVGFIKGFILPTFEVLVMMFPTLNYTVENAKINIGEWQKLVDEKRVTGWTPKKKKLNNEDINLNKDDNIKSENEEDDIKNNIIIDKDSDDEENGLSRNDNNNTTTISNNTCKKSISNTNTPIINDNIKHTHHNSDNGSNGVLNSVNNIINGEQIINKNLSLNLNKKKKCKVNYKKEDINFIIKTNPCNKNTNNYNNSLFYNNGNYKKKNVSPFKINDIKKAYTSTNWVNPIKKNTK